MLAFKSFLPLTILCALACAAPSVKREAALNASAAEEYSVYCGGLEVHREAAAKNVDKACRLLKNRQTIDGYPRLVEDDSGQAPVQYEFPIFEDPSKIYAGGDAGIFRILIDQQCDMRNPSPDNVSGPDGGIYCEYLPTDNEAFP